MQIPTEIVDALRDRIGPIRLLEPLGGLSGRSVVLAHGRATELVAKGPVPSAEVAFATTVAPWLASQGIRTAETSIVETDGGARWLLLEYFPDELPRERWGADESVLGVLRVVHSLPPAVIADISDRFRPSWTASLTSDAVARLGGSPSLAERLHSISVRGGRLFDPQVVLSADPNPNNWRVDGDGRLVLIDWERLTLGHPAIDLGILMPGLGDAPTADAMVALYGDDRVSREDVLLAKAWSLVELAATAEWGSAAESMVLGARDRICAWLTTTPL